MSEPWFPTEILPEGIIVEISAVECPTCRKIFLGKILLGERYKNAVYFNEFLRHKSDIKYFFKVTLKQLKKQDRVKKYKYQLSMPFEVSHIPMWRPYEFS